MYKFSNKETFHAFQWLNNTKEFYNRICKVIDDTHGSPTEVTQTLKNIINEIVKSVNSGVGSKEAHYCLEDIGNVDNINYNEILKEFVGE